MPSATEKAKVRKRREELLAELRELACTCGRASGRPLVRFRVIRSANEPEEPEPPPRPPCPVKHPEGEQQEIVVLHYGLDLTTDLSAGNCKCGTCWLCTHSPRRDTGQEVPKQDRSLPTGKDSVETPQDATRSQRATALAPVLDPPPRSQPAHAPPLSLPGRARDRVVDLAPISVGRIDPSMLPDCAACGHLASFHSEFRLGGTGCAVAGDLGGNGPCTCVSYNGPPPPAPRPRVHALQLPGCTCGQYFGTCICDSQQSNNPKEYPR